MIAGFAPIQYAYMNFWAVLINSSPVNPNTSDLMRLTEAMLLCEEVDNPADQERIREIYANVDEKVHLALPVLELVFLIQMRKGAELNKEIEINNRQFKIFELYEKLDLVNQELVRIVMRVAKQYSLEIPITALSTTSKMITMG